MVRKIGQITAGEVYINEVDVCGRVSELDFGEIGHAEIEHSTLGMIGVLNLPGRPVQAIEGSISFEWLDEEISRAIMMPNRVHRLQVHSYVDIFDADGLNRQSSHILVTHFRFLTMSTGGMTAQLGENLAQEFGISIQAFKQAVYASNLPPIVEYDGWNNIYNINGEAVWPR